MRFLAVAITLVLALTAMAVEPSPRDAVLSLVPPDTAVCFVVQNVRERAAIVAASPFAKWAATKIAPGIEASNEAQVLKFLEKTFSEKLGVTTAELRDDILGDILVQAYQPGPAGKPDEERSVVLLHARNADTLKKLLDKLNALQKDSNELLELKPREYKTIKYTERVKAGGKNEYYLLHDQLFAFASTEAALHAVMDRIAVAPATSPILKTLTDRGAADAFLAVVIAPRAFDAQIQALDPTDTDAEKAGKAQMAKLWTAIDQCVISLTAAEGLELAVSLAYRTADLPAEFQPMLATAPRQSPLWQAMPQNKLFAMAIEAETGVLLKAIASFLPAAERPKLTAQLEHAIGPLIGKDKLPALLAGLGPDLGVWIAPAPDTWFPNIVTALRVKNAPNPGVPRQVHRICGFYLNQFQFHFNQTHADHLDLIEEKFEGLDVRRFANDKLFPPGVSPTMAIHDGYLLVASSPKTAATFKAPAAAVPAATESPVLTLSTKAVHEHLAKHKSDVAQWIAVKQDRPAATIAKELETLTAILEAFDRVDIVLRGDDHSRTFAIKVKTIQPLKPLK